MSSVKLAASVLARGGVAAFPTDTFFALGADALNPTAVSIVQGLKHREDKPMPVLIASIDQMNLFAENLPEDALLLAEVFWPGPLTIVLTRSKEVHSQTTSGDPTIGLRIPNHAIALEIIQSAQVPIIGTSANLRGSHPARCYEQVKQYFPSLECIVKAPCGPFIKPSTVVDMSIEPWTVLREGALSLEKLQEIVPVLMRSTP